MSYFLGGDFLFISVEKQGYQSHDCTRSTRPICASAKAGHRETRYALRESFRVRATLVEATYALTTNPYLPGTFHSRYKIELRAVDIQRYFLHIAFNPNVGHARRFEEHLHVVFGPDCRADGGAVAALAGFAVQASLGIIVIVWPRPSDHVACDPLIPSGLPSGEMRAKVHGIGRVPLSRHNVGLPPGLAFESHGAVLTKRVGVEFASPEDFDLVSDVRVANARHVLVVEVQRPEFTRHVLVPAESTANQGDP